MADMTWTATYFRWKFAALLAAMISVFTLRMLHRWYDLPELVVESTAVLVLLPALLSLLDDRRLRLVALVAGIPVMLLVVVSNLFPAAGLHLPRLVARSGTAAYMLLVVFAILRLLVTTIEVTLDEVVGAFVGYLMVGVLFSELYCVALMLDPRAISGDADDASQAVAAISESKISNPDLRIGMERWNRAQYFSFVTLTTVGYGDLHPRTPLARMLAVVEAITGQFYLAVMVAGLVGIGASQHHSRRQEEANRRIPAEGHHPLGVRPTVDRPVGAPPDGLS
jgi:voltage-gated potassium channel